ncbi:MAG: fatty acid CoA ligase family protein [Planctomycetota bacterium]|nr:fatty acid CoA ligase family protein [Planctomycetota bacterium]
MTATNVGMLLTDSARAIPDQIAIAVSEPKGEKRHYQQMSFQELDRETDLIAAGFTAAGARKGMRLALLVRPGMDFIKLVFGMFKSGLVPILVDPGMGRNNLIQCLSETEPEGFVAIPIAQATRCLLRRRFPKAKFNITVGRRWFWGGKTLKQLVELGKKKTARDRNQYQLNAVKSQDPAAVIFTTGSTGIPKGVLYSHKNFVEQVEEIRDYYHIRPGSVDISGFPLFALFNAGMGVTTVVPKMDFTRPADVNPTEIISAVSDWNADQSFGSPALWTTVGRYCEANNVVLPSLKRVLTAGAPVAPHILRRLKKIIAEDGDIHTPYGATEALPVASIDATTVINETAEKTEKGKGTCVGNRFPGIQTRIIEISDDPISDISQTKELEPFEIGELMVQGDVVTEMYVTRTDSNRYHKVRQGDSFWHRMGDVGYLDDRERFWFCGRKSHRLNTASGPMYTIPCEAIFNTHESIYRTALVGIGDQMQQQPVLVIETWPQQKPTTPLDEEKLLTELKSIGNKSDLTRSIQKFLFIDKMPVDIRHNSKIFREELTVWAEKKLGLHNIRLN